MRLPELHVADAFDRLREEMERVVNRLGVGNGDGLERSAWIPSADLSERDDEFEIRCEIPGVDPANIDVSVSGRTVTISGTTWRSAWAYCRSWASWNAATASAKADGSAKVTPIS